MEAVTKMLEAEERRERQAKIKAENDRRKAEKEKEFEEALRERVGDRMFKYWKSLGPIRRKKQLELWDKEDAKRAVEEAKEQARIEAEEEVKRSTHIYPNGAKYIGGSIKDPDGGTVTPHGQGTYWWSNGQKMYEGKWRKGMKEGHGTYYWLNGNSWSGMFINDAMNGYGVFKSKNGKERGCIYQNGRRTGWIEDIELGARVQMQSTGTQWLSATVIKKFPGSKRLIKYDRKDPVEEIVDFSVRRFRFHHVRQANTYRMKDINEADANPKWQKLAVREPITLTPRAVKEERAAQEAAERARAEMTSDEEESVAPPPSARSDDSMFY